MDPGIRGGLVASPASSPGKVATPTGIDDHPSPDGVSIRRRAFEQESQRPAALGLIVEVNQGLPLRQNQDIDTSIVIQVADSKPAAQQRNLEGRASAIADIDELTAIVGACEELRTHLVGDSGANIVDVAVGRHQVEPPVVVHVEEGDPETEAVAVGTASPTDAV